MKKILMVCLGNICRSPLAEGILRHKAAENAIEMEVDSCGSAAYHIGSNPDPRSIHIARLNGIDISKLSGRQFEVRDFDYFDKIYVMDNSNYQNITKLARNQKDVDKVDLILNVTSNQGIEVPDPYYGGDEEFEQVYQMLDDACNLIIKKNNNHE